MNTYFVRKSVAHCLISEETVEVTVENVLFLMQQDTNGFKLIQEILKFLAQDSKQTLPKRENQTLPKSNSNVSGNEQFSSGSHLADSSSSLKATDISGQPTHIGETRECLLVPVYLPKEAKSHFFCVHGAHRYYGHIAPIAGGFKYQEIFGMYAFGFTDPTHVSEDWGSIRNLAMKYVAEMQAIQPEGPYFLGGYSAGGLISLEMASILVENQEQVGLLVLIDSFPWIPEARNNTNVLLKCVSSGIDKIKNMMFDDYLDDFLKRIAVTRLGMHRKQFEDMLASEGKNVVIDRLLELADKKGVEIPNIDNLYLSITRNFDIAQKSSNNWVPGKALFRGPILFLGAYDKKFTTTSPGIMSHGEMWKAVLGDELHILECAGDHHSMIRDPINATSIGHAIAVTATLILKRLRPYKVQITFFKKSKLMVLKQQGLVVGAFRWKEGLTSATAKIGKLFVNDDESVLVFKEERGKHMLQKQICFQVKDMVVISRNTIPLDIVVMPSSHQMLTTYAVVSIETRHGNKQLVFFCRNDLVHFAQALEALLKMPLPIV